VCRSVVGSIPTSKTFSLSRIAQLVERPTVNRMVVGSSPTPGAFSFVFTTNIIYNSRMDKMWFVRKCVFYIVDALAYVVLCYSYWYKPSLPEWLSTPITLLLITNVICCLIIVCGYVWNKIRD
jgi:hypothetical protein